MSTKITPEKSLWKWFSSQSPRWLHWMIGIMTGTLAFLATFYYTLTWHRVTPRSGFDEHCFILACVVTGSYTLLVFAFCKIFVKNKNDLSNKG